MVFIDILINFKSQDAATLLVVSYHVLKLDSGLWQILISLSVTVCDTCDLENIKVKMTVSPIIQ